MERYAGIEPAFSAWKAEVICHYTNTALSVLVPKVGVEPTDDGDFKSPGDTN